MSEVNITSHNQSGGITANTISYNNSDAPKGKKDRKKKLKIFIVIGFIASVVTILTYFDINPFQNRKEPASQTNNIKNNVNSPISTKVEHQTINYFQSDSPKHSESKSKDKFPNKSAMEKDKESKINVTSYNQSGGITANQVNINSPQRFINENLKTQLVEAIDTRLLRYNLDKNCLINIFAPQDAEATRFGIQIRDYLKNQGYNVWHNLSTYMGNVGLDTLDIGFKFDDKKKQLQVYINLKQK